MKINEAREVLNTIVYKNAYFYLDMGIYDEVLLRVKLPVKDACSGYAYTVAPEIKITSEQRFPIEHFQRIQKDEFLYLVRKMCQRLELHEVDEHFKVDGICYTDPHPERKHA